MRVRLVHFFKKVANWFVADALKRRLRDALRAHSSLVVHDQLNKIEVIKRAIAKHRVDAIADEIAQRGFLPLDAEQVELALRQYLVSRVAGFGLNTPLLANLHAPQKAYALPIPSIWLPILAEHNILQVTWKRRLAWSGQVFAYLGHGCLTIVRQLVQSSPFFRNGNDVLKGSVHLNEISANHLPNPALGTACRSLATWWLAQEQARSKQANDKRVLTHTVRPLPAGKREDDADFRVVTSALPVFETWTKWFAFVLWCMLALSQCLIDFIRGRWAKSLLLAEVTLFQRVHRCEPKELAAEYWFHNSSHIFRPLWTYEAEKNGALIGVYFYSLNCDSFKRADGYQGIPHHWDLASWSHYMVWNENQRAFVERALLNPAAAGRHSAQKPIFHITGPIPFSEKDAPVPPLERKTIALFDVQPVRSSIYKTLGANFDFYIAEQSIAFLTDVVDCARKHGYHIVWKRKRDVGKVLHPAFRNAVEKLLSENTHLIEIDPGISAERAMASCDLVISMPFTSTAIAAKTNGKASCFYDAMALLQADDRAAQGIAIIQDKNALDAWIETAGNGLANLEQRNL